MGLAGQEGFETRTGEEAPLTTKLQTPYYELPGDHLAVSPGPTSSGLPFPVPPEEFHPTSRSPVLTHSWPLCILCGKVLEKDKKTEDVDATNICQSLEKCTPFDMVALWLDIVPK